MPCGEFSADKGRQLRRGQDSQLPTVGTESCCRGLDHQLNREMWACFKGASEADPLPEMPHTHPWQVWGGRPWRGHYLALFLESLGLSSEAAPSGTSFLDLELSLPPVLGGCLSSELLLSQDSKF